MDAQSDWTGLDAARLGRIGDHLKRHFVDAGRIAGCQVAVWRRGREAYATSIGLADAERGVPMRQDAIHRIYSMTKPITSVALMTLYEQGLFHLDDPISRFLPAWKDQQVYVSGAGAGADMVTEPPKRPPTVRDLLRHTAGLTYGGVLASVGAATDEHPVDLAYAERRIRRDRNETLADMVSKLATVPLRYQPGERWMYSLSTDVCGALVEILSGKPLDAYIAETITGPLGMVDTAFQVPPEKAGRLSACYRYARGGYKLADDPATSEYLHEPTFLSGGGGLVGTVGDYVRFAEMLRRGGELDGARIISPRTLAMMHQNHLPDGRRLSEMALDFFSETANDGVGFGLGFASVVDNVAAGSVSQGDFYWGGAASTIFWVDPKEELSVVFMAQLMPSSSYDFRSILRSIVYGAIVD